MTTDRRLRLSVFVFLPASEYRFPASASLLRLFTLPITYIKNTTQNISGRLTWRGWRVGGLESWRREGAMSAAADRWGPVWSVVSRAAAEVWRPRWWSVNEQAGHAGGGVLLQPLVHQGGDLFAEIGGVAEAGQFKALQTVARSSKQKLPGGLGPVTGQGNSSCGDRRSDSNTIVN